MREVFELIFVTVFTGVGAYIRVFDEWGAGWLGVITGAIRLRTLIRSQPLRCNQDRAAEDRPPSDRR